MQLWHYTDGFKLYESRTEAGGFGDKQGGNERGYKGQLKGLYIVMLHPTSSAQITNVKHMHTSHSNVTIPATLILRASFRSAQCETQENKLFTMKNLYNIYTIQLS